MAGGVRGFLAFWLGGAKAPNSQLASTGTGTATFTGASFADGVLSSTGTGTVSAVGASFANGALASTGTATVGLVSDLGGNLSATGTATVSFAIEGLIGTEGTFRGTGATNFVGSFGYESPRGKGEGVGRFAETWNRYRQEQSRRDRRRALLLAQIRQSKEYKRLQRMLGMLEEHLGMADYGYEKRRIEARIAKIKLEMRRMEDRADQQVEDEFMELM